MADNHPWALVGPWYRWPQPGVLNSGRQSAPVLQKYETSDLVNEFLKDPQHSLQFVNEDYSTSGGQSSSASTPLKLFLDTHKRFYLVVCELHCDSAGFPNTSQDAVCEAGFVIRRKVPKIPEGQTETVKQVVQGINQARAEMNGANGIFKKFFVRDEFDRYRISAQLAYTERFEQLDRLGVTLETQGWLPSGFQNVGSWQAVDEMPQSITETILPLYPLVADPRVKDHSGRGRAIYFGVLPTASAETDARGVARYDSETLYEARCFVRRHRFPCPKLNKRGDCRGELVWSRRTRSYRLAPHMDLTGTNNRPVTIQLPDIPALQAQAKTMPPGTAPVRMVSPASSNLEFKVNTSNLQITKLPASGAICSFCIPLITIVATFVLKLFLPIVVFVFQLYFLLKLKFCIPPSFSLDAGVVADLNAALEVGVQADIDAVVTASIDPAIQANFGTTDGNAVIAALSTEDRGQLAADLSLDFGASVGLPATPGAATAAATSVTDNLLYEPRVEVQVS